MKKIDKICNMVFNVLAGYVTLESLHAILMGDHMIAGVIGTFAGIAYFTHVINEMKGDDK